MAQGGFRIGAGRKKGSKAPHTLEADRAKQFIVQEFIKELAPMIKAQIKQAKKGNVYAFDKLSERALGKVSDKLILQEVKKLIEFDA